MTITMVKKINKSTRTKGIAALYCELTKQRNVQIIEKSLYKNTSYDNEYLFAVQQTIFDIRQKKKTLGEILRCIKAKQIGWRHTSLQEIKQEVEEIFEYIENPFEVEEGIFQCNSCFSKRVLSYQKQTRGGDESATTFSRCANCGHSWVYSG